MMNVSTQVEISSLMESAVNGNESNFSGVEEISIDNVLGGAAKTEIGIWLFFSFRVCPLSGLNLDVIRCKVVLIILPH